MITEIFSISIELIVLCVFLVNLTFAVAVVFFERKSPQATVAWLMVLIILPLVGFVLYIFLGQSFYRKKMFKIKQDADTKYSDFVRMQESGLNSGDDHLSASIPERYKDLARMLLRSNRAMIAPNNNVVVYSEGEDKFRDLLSAIRNAKSFIHLEYYILKDDNIGTELFEALTAKAKEGVEVRFLGDALGCVGPKKEFYQPLLDAGGKVAFFFPSLIRLSYPRINYRNHRKIAVIDGKVGFIGGYNIGDNYLSHDPEWAPWRDAAVRIVGSGIIGLQMRFMQDWNYASKNKAEYLIPIDKETLGKYLVRSYDDTLKDPAGFEDVALQIVSGGPDAYWNPIKESYAKMISLARKSVYIQTPYFIPDDTILDSLRMAALSGVDVKIMFPSRPDHMFVYWAGYSYLEQLFDAGVKVYMYRGKNEKGEFMNGFIHAKTIVVDEDIGSIGSANWDVRSFKLNFESNALMYNAGVAKRMKELFLSDLPLCEELTHEKIEQLPKMIRIKLSLSRLFSPML